MSEKFTWVLLTVMAFSCGCAVIRVETELDESVDFSKLRSYAWMPRDKMGGGRLSLSEAAASCIRTSVEQELNARGYRHVAEEHPSFAIRYDVLVDETVRPRTVNGNSWSDTRTGDRDADLPSPRSGFRYAGDRWQWGRSEPETVPDSVEIGTLLVEMLDANTGRFIWRGAAQLELLRSTPEARKSEQICAAVARMLQRFPSAR